MGIKIKKELKPQQKLVPLHVKYLIAVPIIGIVDIFTMLSFYNKMPAEGMMGAKLFYIFFALVGAGFAYCTFMWKLTSDNKMITVRRPVGSKKEIKYDQVKKVEVHKKKRNNSLSYYTLLGEDGAVFAKIYPIMSGSGELLERLDRLGIKREEFVDC